MTKKAIYSIFSILFVAAIFIWAGYQFVKTVNDGDFYWTHPKEATKEFTADQILLDTKNGEMREFNDFDKHFRAFKDVNTKEVFYIRVKSLFTGQDQTVWKRK